MDNRERQRLLLRVASGRGFLVKTDGCESLLAFIVQSLQLGSTGALVYGENREGKSCAALWAMSKIPEVLGPVPTISVPLRDMCDPSESHFFSHFLNCARHRFAYSRSVSTLRNRATELIVQRANNCALRTTVVLVDEAQELGEHQWSWLRDISNEVSMRGANVFFLLVGSPKLIDVRDEMISKHQAQIVGRFMLDMLQFKGICSEQSLQKCLSAFDHVVYPAKSQTRFGEQFCPRRIAAGLQFADNTAAIWGEFAKITQESGLPEVDIPMKYLTGFVLNLLLLLAPQDADQPHLDATMVTSAMQRSGFQTAMIIRADMQRPG